MKEVTHYEPEEGDKVCYKGEMATIIEVGYCLGEDWVDFNPALSGIKDCPVSNLEWDGRLKVWDLIGQ